MNEVVDKFCILVGKRLLCLPRTRRNLLNGLREEVLDLPAEQRCTLAVLEEKYGTVQHIAAELQEYVPPRSRVPVSGASGISGFCGWRSLRWLLQWVLPLRGCSNNVKLHEDPKDIVFRVLFCIRQLTGGESRLHRHVIHISAAFYHVSADTVRGKQNDLLLPGPRWEAFLL